MVQEKRIAEELLGAIALMQSSPAPNPAVQEALSNVQAMLARDDRGWDLLRGDQAADEGMSLPELKQWSKKLREFAAANPLGKRGFHLRHAFINRGGIHHEGIPTETRGRGLKPSVSIKDPINRRNFFGADARRKRELSLYTDSIALYIGNDDTKRLYPIPLSQISGYLTDPDFPGVVWAYRRTWEHRKPNGEKETLTRWYFVNEFVEYRKAAPINWNGTNEPVDQKHVAFDQIANAFDGWPLGIPDALAGWIWADIAKSLYMDGVDVSEALATLAFKVTTASKTAQSNAALQFAGPQTAGGTAVMGVGSDLSVLSSAGRGYDFSGIREVISFVATSLDVSTIQLTSNTADAGSSYGSAQTLDLPQALTLSLRREEHVAFEERILRWMGAEDATAYYEKFDDGTEVYRRLQAVTLPWLQGVIDAQTYAELVSEVLGVPNLGSIPEGVMLPNNIASTLRPDVDEPTGSTASPTQGRANDSGTTRAARDTRDDQIA